MKVQPREPELVEEDASSITPLLLVLGLIVATGLVAGLPVLVMILALLVCIFLHELGHYLTAKSAGMKVTEFFIGFGPRIWSFRRGEVEYGIKAIPAGAYVRIIGMSNLETDIAPEDEERTYRSKPYWRRLSVAVAGSTMHMIIAFVLLVTVFAGFGLRDAEADDWSIYAVTPDSAADDAGLEAGDRIASVDGREFGDFDAMSEYLRAHPGEDVSLVVERGSETLTLTATLGAENPNTGEKVGFLGVGPTFPTVREGPIASVRESIGEIGNMTSASVGGLGKLFSKSGVTGYVDQVVNGGDGSDGPTTEQESRPSSVVGIVQVGNEVARDGWVNVVYLIAAFNVFIAIFNMLPVLPFDGGHVAIATYEKVRSMISGRRYQADAAKMLPVAYVVVVAMALLFVTSVYLDIADPVSIR
jgi:membrane-associated protease RseP (regulator of RpoE activity)